MPFKTDKQRKAFFARQGMSFSPARRKAISQAVSIKSPSRFKQSVRILSKGGLSVQERKVLVMAQDRADMQLQRKDLSSIERRQFKEIKGVNIPPSAKTARTISRVPPDPFRQARERMKLRKTKKDLDGDGVPNDKDCEPLNPKKQGRLHDLQIALLRRKEEKLERVREKELKKLEDTKDSLKEKQAIASQKAGVKSIMLQRKQAIIDELNTEKTRIQELKTANKQAKDQLDKLTVTGKTKTALIKSGKFTAKAIAKGSKATLESSQAFLKKESTKKALKNVKKFFVKLGS